MLHKKYMNVLATDKTLDKINELLILEMSLLNIMEGIDSLLVQGYGCYLNFDEKVLEDCAKEVEGINTKKDAERLFVISGMVNEFMGQPETEEEQDMHAAVTTSLFLHSKRFTKKEIMKNPFLQKIKPKEEYTVGKYTLDIADTEKGELFYYDKENIEGILHIPSIGYCSQRFEFPCIRIENEMYYFVNPQIINQYTPIVKNVSGHVLSLGLGIGYFEYMAHLKDDIEKITIIEKDKDLIKIFTEKILPHFEHPEKIEIIKAEPINYIRKTKDKQYDFCVVDTSAEPEEIIADYLRIKHEERRMPNTSFLYFDEESVLLDIQSFVLMEILNDTDPESSEEDDYGFIENPATIQKLQDIYANEFVLSVDELERITDIETIRKHITKNA